MLRLQDKGKPFAVMPIIEQYTTVVNHIGRGARHWAQDLGATLDTSRRVLESPSPAGRRFDETRFEFSLHFAGQRPWTKLPDDRFEIRISHPPYEGQISSFIVKEAPVGKAGMVNVGLLESVDSAAPFAHDFHVLCLHTLWLTPGWTFVRMAFPHILSSLILGIIFAFV